MSGPSLRLKLANAASRALLRPLIARQTDPARARRDLARVARFIPVPSRVQEERVAGLRKVTCGPVQGAGAVFYIHGGGYIAGSPDTHRALIALLACETALPVFAPSYGLAPEHPAPAAYEDVRAAHAALVAQGFAPERIVIGGDSAGGGVGLALLAHLCALDQRPAGLFAYSPFTDPAAKGGSRVENARRDRIFDVDRLPFLMGFVTGPGGIALEDPRLAPARAAFDAPPPVWLAASETEILRDDTLRMAETLEGAGGDVTVRLHPDAPHAWPFVAGLLPEAVATIAESAAFARKCLNLPPRTP